MPTQAQHAHAHALQQIEQETANEVRSITSILNFVWNHRIHIFDHSKHDSLKRLYRENVPFIFVVTHTMRFLLLIIFSCQVKSRTQEEVDGLRGEIDQLRDEKAAVQQEVDRLSEEHRSLLGAEFIFKILKFK